jgi:hypothetical protein
VTIERDPGSGKRREGPEEWGEIEGIRPPIIHVKKGADVGTDYYYDKQKRLALASAPQPREIKGIFRTFLQMGRGRTPRRGGISVLFPVLIIALAAIVIFRFTGRTDGQDSISGYRAVLRADPYDSSLLVSVSLTPPARSSGDGSVTVRFSLPDTGEELIVSSALAGELPVVRGKMHYTGKEKSVRAEVRIAGQSKTLVTSIRAPAGNP